ncbi:SH3 domain-containing protein [Sulfitobacter dubius]|uniref:SH3 domain-containing protein n=1 Tax=Sulfitobacter dubius TaxID=218673 RepID=UPI001428966F|nr:SH3 domain-containing protein [Sulfitobacter dubius]
MMKYAAAIIVLLSYTPLSAQQLDMDFLIEEDEQAAGCLGASVEGLDPNRDGFLAVRTVPGTNYRKIDELHNGDGVRPCVRNGNWWGVYYGNPRRNGWVHGNWLGRWVG